MIDKQVRKFYMERFGAFLDDIREGFTISIEIQTGSRSVPPGKDAEKQQHEETGENAFMAWIHPSGAKPNFPRLVPR